jgi:hypothetical protein
MKAAKTAKRPKAKKLRRNPIAKALGSGLFKPRVKPKPGLYKRRPKHRKPEDETE